MERELPSENLKYFIISNYSRLYKKKILFNSQLINKVRTPFFLFTM